MSNIITFNSWAITECFNCGIEYQVTRTEGRTKLLNECLCEGCESYDRGFKDGGKGVKPLEDALISIIAANSNWAMSMDDKTVDTINELITRIQST